MPVRDEEKTLPRLLAGLSAQAECNLARITLCIFLDGCADRSAAVLNAHAPALPFPIMVRAAAPQPVANAGRARRAAMDIGQAALGSQDGLLLTTDADSVPASDWIARSRAALDVADVVAGRIIRIAAEPSRLQDRIETYYDRLCALRRQLDPVSWDDADPHHFTGGANLGFRRAAYAAIGGFQPLRSGEDATIVDDAARLGLRVRRDGASIVQTSSRRDGRAVGGLATHLEQLDRSPEVTPRCAHPADMAWQYRMQALARASFDAERLDTMAGLLDLPIDHLVRVARDCANSEAFAMRIVPTPPGGIRQVGLDEAESALAILERQPMERAA